MYGFVMRKSAYRYKFGVWPTVKTPTDRVSKMYDRGVLWYGRGARAPVE